MSLLAVQTDAAINSGNRWASLQRLHLNGTQCRGPMRAQQAGPAVASQPRNSGVSGAPPPLPHVCVPVSPLCSGGPVMNSSGKCVGIAFQALTGDTQSVG